MFIDQGEFLYYVLKMNVILFLSVALCLVIKEKEKTFIGLDVFLNVLS